MIKENLEFKRNKPQDVGYGNNRIELTEARILKDLKNLRLMYGICLAFISTIFGLMVKSLMEKGIFNMEYGLLLTLMIALFILVLSPFLKSSRHIGMIMAGAYGIRKDVITRFRVKREQKGGVDYYVGIEGENFYFKVKRRDYKKLHQFPEVYVVEIENGEVLRSAMYPLYKFYWNPSSLSEER